MPNLAWSRLNHLQIGKYAEYLCKLEFISYGLDVYAPEIDDHGVDFVIKANNSQFYEVQVKSMFKTNYVFITKEKIIIDGHHLICLVKFSEGQIPEIYMFPATVWMYPNALFVDRNYDCKGQISKPEWGINYSKKNHELLLPYRLESTIKNLLAI